MKSVLRLMAFAKKHWVVFLLAFVCLSAVTAFGLVVPRVLGQGIDTVLQSGARSTIVMAAWIIIGASCLRGLAAYCDRYLREVASQQVAYDVRNAVYDHL